MNAGAFTHRITFISSVRKQSASGAVRDERQDSFHTRAFLKTLRPTFNKNGLQAQEVVDPSSLVFVVRDDRRIFSCRWLRWRGDIYSIVLLKPLPDRTVEVTSQYVDE